MLSVEERNMIDKTPSFDVGSTWVAKSANTTNPMIWTIKGNERGAVYFTCPESRSPGHLLSQEDFQKQYFRV